MKEQLSFKFDCFSDANQEQTRKQNVFNYVVDKTIKYNVLLTQVKNSNPASLYSTLKEVSASLRELAKYLKEELDLYG
jgi:hypothetical protein